MFGLLLLFLFLCYRGSSPRFFHNDPKVASQYDVTWFIEFQPYFFQGITVRNLT
jgi:hypothetical protein